MKSKLFAAALTLLSFHAAHCEPLFTKSGSDPTFEQLLKTGKLTRGKNSASGVTGSVIHVNNGLVETTPEAKRPIPRAIDLHTLTNSHINRKDFKKWTRWYQEDGNTQVFRLFKGETNLHNSRALAARTETFSELHWKHGAWHEWSGTFTLIQPHGASILQVKNGENAWSVMINAHDNGDIKLNHRRAPDKIIATNMIGKPFRIRVRDNGREYEVFLDGKKVGEGFYERPVGTTCFRWGMYVGGNEVRHDAMIFVSGVTIDGH